MSNIFSNLLGQGMIPPQLLGLLMNQSTQVPQPSMSPQPSMPQQGMMPPQGMTPSRPMQNMQPQGMSQSRPQQGAMPNNTLPQRPNAPDIGTNPGSAGRFQQSNKLRDMRGMK